MTQTITPGLEMRLMSIATCGIDYIGYILNEPHILDHSSRYALYNMNLVCLDNVLYVSDNYIAT